MHKFTFLLLLSIALTGITTAQTHLEFSHYKAYNKVEFDYTVLTPDNYDKNKAYPALFAFSSGDQDREAIEWAVKHMWGVEKSQDWLIILPTIPRTELAYPSLTSCTGSVPGSDKEGLQSKR